jgi:WD40 repeat protein
VRKWLRPLVYLAAFGCYLIAAFALWLWLQPGPRYKLPKGCFALRCSSDGQVLLTARMEVRWGWRSSYFTRGPVEAWDAATGRLLMSCCDTAQVGGAALSPDKRLLAVWQGIGAADQSIRVFDVATTEQCSVIPGLSVTNGLFRFAPDNRTLAVSTGTAPQHSLTLIDVRGERPPRVVDGLCEPVAFSPDSRMVAAAVATGQGNWTDNTGEIQLIDVATADVLARFPAQAGMVKPTTMAA